MSNTTTRSFVFELLKLKSVIWKANLMTQKCRPNILLCLVSICLPKIILWSFGFWLLVSLLTACIKSLIILELQLATEFWRLFVLVLLEALHSCITEHFLITPCMAITVTRVLFVIKTMVASQIKKLYLMKMRLLWI